MAAGSIENEIVKMQFDNAEFSKKIAETIASLDKLTAALQFKGGLSGFAAITGEAQKVDISSVSAGVQDINWTLLAVKTAAETVFRNMTNAAINAGMKITKALTIQGAMDGFNEYELKMGAIQTMMAGSGESLGTVNKALAELNTYSDKTIYSFGDMTQNIGKFTNAGVKLKPAVAAIKGVANVAAVSGANAEEASRAMYNFGQALSSGYVKLVDWKSIELANMGTKEFKTQLLEAAVAAGTAKRMGNGYYKVLTENMQGKTMEKTISATKGFNDSLQYQWMTSKVLTNTLNDYADANTKIGAKAQKAATEVKTFTQMISTIKESIGSGWGQSAELIFGDKNEATKLWTSLAGAIGSVIGPLEEARNKSLKFWKDNGGRDAVIKGFSNVFKAFGAVLKPIGKAFNEVFNPDGGKMLLSFSKGFEKFTQKLIPTKGFVEGIASAFRLLFESLKFTFDIAKGAVVAVGALFGAIKDSTIFKGMAAGFKMAADNVAAFFGAIRKSAPDGDKMKEQFSAITRFLDGIGAVFTSVLTAAKAFAAKIGAALKPVVDKLRGMFGELNLENVLKVFGAGLGVLNFVELRKMVASFQGISDVFEGLGKVLKKKIIDIFDGFTGVLQGMQNKLNAEALKQVAIAVAILAASMFLISMIKPERLKGAMLAISMLLVEVMGIMSGFEKLNTKGVGGINKAAFALSLIGGALIIMSIAVERLGRLKPDELMRGLIAIGALLGGLGLFVSFVKVDKGLIGAGAGMIMFSVAILLLSKSVSMLGEMDSGQLTQGLTALAGLFTFVMVSSKLLSSAKGSAASMILLAVGVMIMSKALQTLGGMSYEEIGRGMTALGGAMVAMVAALMLIPTDAALRAVGALIMSAAVYVLAMAMQQMGSMDWGSIGRGLAGIGGALLLLAAFLYAASNPLFLVGAIALMVASGALVVLATAMGIVSALSPGAIAKGLGAIAIGLLAIIAAGYLAIGALPGLAGIALLVLSIGASIFLAGAGMGMLAAGIGALAAALAVGGPVIVAFIVELAKQLPTIAKSIALAIGAFALGLVEQQEALTLALVSLFGVVLTALTTVVPQVLTFLSTLITGLLTLIVAKVPEIVRALLTLLVALVDAVAAFVPKFVESAGNLLVAFINALGRYYNRLATAGANFIIKLLQGLSRQMVRVADAAMDTVIKFIEGLTRAINKNGKRFDTAAKGLIEALFNRAKSLLTTTYDFGKLASDLIGGLVKGITDGAWRVGRAVADMVKDAFKAGKDASDSHSPSRLFATLTTWWVQGMLRPLERDTTVAKAAGAIANAAYNAMLATAVAAQGLFDDITPTVTPVLNMDDLKRGVGSITTMLSSMPAVEVSTKLSGKMNADATRKSNSDVNKDEASQGTTFNQYNYSPEPLSRRDLYRKTKNLVGA